MKSEYQKMIAGEPYRPFDSELRALAQTARQKQAFFNEEVDPLKGMEIIKGWFGSTGENLYVNPRLVVDYGVNIHLGENFYSNWNLTMLDVCPITIGDNAMIGPNCQFLTPLHPLDPDERNSGLEFGKPITIGKNFWAGGGVIVLPGVTLGDNVVAGAGAVITKSFGDNVVLAGNPARVIKEIPVKENERFQKEKVKSFSKELFGIGKPYQCQYQRLIAIKKRGGNFYPSLVFISLEIFSLLSFFSESHIAFSNVACKIASDLEVIGIRFQLGFIDDCQIITCVSAINCNHVNF